MLSDLKDDYKHVESLVGNVIEDAQSLVGQEIALLKSEIKEEVSRVKSATSSLVIGAVFAAVGAAMMCVALANLVVYLYPQMALWESYAALAVMLELVGVLFLINSRRKSRNILKMPAIRTELRGELQ